MNLKNPLFSANDRINLAAMNAPPMSRGEPNKDAVRILQNVLIGLGMSTMRLSIKPDGTLDGGYGGETVEGVKCFQKTVGLVNKKGKADGVVGENTMRELDERAPYQLVPVTIPGTNSITPNAENQITTDKSNTVKLPNASNLLAEYTKFRAVNGKPCQRSDIHNQCAIRMSVALMRCNIGFHFDNPSLEYTHSGNNKACGLAIPHNAGAQRLFNHLKTIWTFQKFTKNSNSRAEAEKIYNQIMGKPGIIFFQDCFTRKGSTIKKGDHLDYWDGNLIMNDRLAYSAPEERSVDNVKNSLHLFQQSKKYIWFLNIN